MQKTFTKNHILFYLYAEMNEDCKSNFLINLQQDHLLRNDFMALQESKNLLDKIECSPSQSTLNNIMAFEKGLQVHSSKYLRLIDFILNYPICNIFYT